jgi:hypothetical protein
MKPYHKERSRPLCIVLEDTFTIGRNQKKFSAQDFAGPAFSFTVQGNCHMILQYKPEAVLIPAMDHPVASFGYTDLFGSYVFQRKTANGAGLERHAIHILVE